MFHECGVDILDLGTERLSYRRLRSLLVRLPRESWTVREAQGDVARWGDQEHLLATVIDVLVQANWMFASANSKQPPPMPERLRRPGDPAPDNKIGGKRSYSASEVNRILATMKPRVGGD